MSKPELLSLTKAELEVFFGSLGEPSYRASQMFPLLNRGENPADMTCFSKALREKIAESSEWHLPRIERKLVSGIDGTVKYLFSLADGNCVESVVMKYKYGNTVCISSQVGCRMGCRQCDNCFLCNHLQDGLLLESLQNPV